MSRKDKSMNTQEIKNNIEDLADYLGVSAALMMKFVLSKEHLIISSTNEFAPIKKFSGLTGSNLLRDIWNKYSKEHPEVKPGTVFGYSKKKVASVIGTRTKKPILRVHLFEEEDGSLDYNGVQYPLVFASGSTAI